MKTIILKPHFKRGRASLAGQRGQATLELVLVLLVGVLIALGLIYRFNTAFKKYTVDMYGTYYRCLLETGELPGTGSVCRDKEVRFNIANGRDLVRDGGTGGSGGGGSGGGGSDGSGGNGSNGSGGGNGSGKGGGKGSSGGQSGQSGSDGSGGSGSGSGSDSGGGGSESVGGRGRTSGGGRGSVIGRLRNLQNPRSTAVGKASDAAGGVGHTDDPVIAVSANTRAQAEGLRRVQTKMDFKMDGAEYQRPETASVTATTAAPVKKSVQGGDSLRPRKAVENTDRKPATSAKDDKGGGLEFGRIFRLFIIIGIIIAIIVFLGGQMLQISKSGDK